MNGWMDGKCVPMTLWIIIFRLLMLRCFGDLCGVLSV